MNKNQLIEFIQGLPDDLYVEPIEYSTVHQETIHECLNKHIHMSDISYTFDDLSDNVMIDNTLVLKLNFKQRNVLGDHDENSSRLCEQQQFKFIRHFNGRCKLCSI